MKKNLKRSLTLVIILVISIQTKSETNEKSYSTSVTGMVELLEIERELIESVHKYSEVLEKKVNDLKNLAKELKVENSKSFINPEKYLSNPINAYALIRRMHYDWNYIEKFMMEPIGLEFYETIQKYEPLMTTARDVIEASDGLYRLQMVYDLNPLDIAEGFLNGKQYDARLKSIDQYFMGAVLFSEKLYYDAGIWLNSSLTSYAESDYYKIIKFGKETILELYAETLMAQNHTRSALNAITQALELQPNDEHLLERKNEMQLIANVVPDIIMEDSKPSTVPITSIGCRGGFANFSSQLYCVYNATTSQYLHLAPLKMEILRWDPFMVMFHDVMSDFEIEHVKWLAKPNLTRHTIYNKETARYEVFEAKTRKFFNIPFNATDIIKGIDRKITGIVGFPMQRAFLHVATYGLGGHIDHHNDEGPAGIKFNAWDRMPTILFYMSDVEQGGATVFPNIRTAAFPRKGSALVFENLRNGIMDERAIHAGCPVLMGSKWVAV